MNCENRPDSPDREGIGGAGNLGDSSVERSNEPFRPIVTSLARARAVREQNAIVSAIVVKRRGVGIVEHIVDAKVEE